MREVSECKMFDSVYLFWHFHFERAVQMLSFLHPDIVKEKRICLAYVK